MGSGQLSAALCVSGGLAGALSAEGALEGRLTIAGAVPSYAGPCEATPGSADQVIPCAGLVMPADFTVRAVPAGWGRIGWDGITLTVS